MNLNKQLEQIKMKMKKEERRKVVGTNKNKDEKKELKKKVGNTN